MNSESTGTTVNEVSLQTNSSASIGEMVISREEVKSGDVSKEMVQTVGGNFPVPLDDVLTRNVLIHTGVITSSDVAWANIFGTSINPWDSLLTDPLIISKIKGYARFRGDVEVTLVVSPPSNAYGAYCMSAVCDGGAMVAGPGDVVADDAAADNPYTATQDIHGVVNVSLATTVKMELPFVYPFDAIDLTDTRIPTGEVMWRLNLWAWSPIRNCLTADAVSATYKLYARFLPGYELSLPRFQAKGGKIKSAGVSITTGGGGSSGSGAIRAPGKLSGFASKIGQAAGVIGAAVPALAPFAGPIAVGAGIASQIADMFGFTRDTDVTPPVKVVGKVFSNIANMDGEDQGTVVALSQTNATSIDPRIGGGIEGDPTTFADLFARWTLIGKSSWTTSSAVGTNLMDIPVTPGICASVLGVRYPSTCAYVGLPFQRWRGSMEYMIFVPTSPYHRGALQVVWDPIVSDGLSGDLTNRLSNVIFDTTVDDVLQVRVNYASTSPCKQMDLVGVSVPYGDTEQLNGVVRILVHSTLQTPSTSGNTVDVLVFARACPDMRFGVPRYLVWNHDATFRGDFGTMYLLQGGIGDDDEEGIKKVNLVGSGDLDRYPIDALAWGEDFSSVRPLMQKFSQIIRFDGSHQGQTPTFPHFWPVRKAIPGGGGTYVWLQTLHPLDTPTWSWFSHYAGMFVGVRGSVRYKLMPITSQFVAATYTTYQDGHVDVSGWLNEGLNNYTSLTTCCAIEPSLVGDKGAEFLVPYYSDRKYWCNRVIVPTSSSPQVYTQEMRFNALSFSTGVVDNGPLFYAGGPDIAPVRFRRVPAIKYAG